MSLISVFLAAAVVVLQTTLILSNHEANLWVFSLLQKRRFPSDWGNISAASVKPIHSLQEVALPSSKSEADTPLIQCVERAWEAGDWPPEYCPFWSHAAQEVSAIFGGSTWNPHLILLAILCVHFVAILANAHAEHQIKINSNLNKSLSPTLSYATRIYQFPLSLCLCLLFMLWLIAGLIASNRRLSGSQPKINLLDTPTVIVSVLLFASCAWFIRIHHQFYPSSSSTGSVNEVETDEESYYLWNQSFQLQMIAVPLSVITLVVMGVRVYTEVITHFILLSVAVNTLWLQRSLFSASQKHNLASNNVLFLTLKVITLGIPLYSLFTAQAQWGENSTWQQITVFMAFFSLAPLLAFSFLSTAVTGSSTSETRQWKKMQLKIGSISSIAALGSTVINLALF